MTVTDQIKILDKKIKQNEAQYNLDRKAAKISALSSNNLDKYEYLTGEDLGLKPSTVEQAKFEYSPLGKIFNKGLKEEDKKEGLLKRLKNIEGKNKEQLKAIKDQGEKQLDAIKKNNQLKDHGTKNVVLLKNGLKELIESYPSTFNTFVRNEVRELAAKEENIDYKKISQEIFSYGFNFLEKCGTPYRFLKNLIANKISINTVNDDQRDFVFNLMKGYNISSFFFFKKKKK